MLDMTCSEKRSALAVKALNRHVQELGSLRFPEQHRTNYLSPNLQRILCSLIPVEINRNEVSEHLCGSEPLPVLKLKFCQLSACLVYLD